MNKGEGVGVGIERGGVGVVKGLRGLEVVEVVVVNGLDGVGAEGVALAQAAGVATPRPPTLTRMSTPNSDAASADRHPILRRRLRHGLGAFFIVAGVAHFVAPHLYDPMMPDWLPAASHRPLIYFTGLAELAGGIGVSTTHFRRAAAWGLIALLIAIFPANLHVALNPSAGVDLRPLANRALAPPPLPGRGSQCPNPM